MLSHDTTNDSSCTDCIIILADIIQLHGFSYFCDTDVSLISSDAAVDEHMSLDISGQMKTNLLDCWFLDLGLDLTLGEELVRATDEVYSGSFFEGGDVMGLFLADQIIQSNLSRYFDEL